MNIISRILYRRPKINGIHTSCPKCDTAHHSCKKVGEKKYKRRTEVYMECPCGCKYKYHFGI